MSVSDVVGWVLLAAVWAWLGLCLLGVLGVVLELLAHYVGLVEEWAGPPVQRWLARRRSVRARS